MDKFGMKLLPAALLPAVCVLSFVSCVNKDYNIDKLNTEVTFAKSGLSFPIGTTAKITLTDLLGIDEVSTPDGSTHSDGAVNDYLYVNDGKYSICYSEKLSSEGMVEDLTDKLRLSDIIFENEFSLTDNGSTTTKSANSSSAVLSAGAAEYAGDASAQAVVFTDDFNERFDLILISAKELPAEVKIKGVSKAVLDGVYANISVDILTALKDGINPEIDITVDFPSEIRLDECDSRVSDNKLRIQGKFSNGKFVVAPIRIQELELSGYDFSKGEDLTVHALAHGTFTISSDSFNIGDYGGSIKSIISMSIKDIKFQKLSGRFDYSFHADPVNISLSNIPSILKGAVLDFYNPYLTLDINSNLNIPVFAKVSMTPVLDGKELTSSICEIQIPVEPYADASSPAVQRFFIAADNKGLSGLAEGRKFIENAGVKSLLKQIPDKIKVETSLSTDSSRESTIEPAVATVLDADYSVVCPLAFGPDLYIEAADTLTGIDKTLAELMLDNVVQITGSAINTMPIELELKIDLLDGSDNVLPLKSEATQTIGSCNSHGETCITHLCCTLDIDESVSADDIKAIKLTYRMKSGSAVGIPITESSYVQAQLSLTLPQGLSMDLKNKDKDGEDNENEQE